MNFNKWLMNESTSQQAKGLLSTIEDIVGKAYGMIHIVPDFETFERPNEPKQNSVLVGTSSGVSFALNYTGSELYSIDMWDKDSIEPDYTVYAEGHPMEAILNAIIAGEKTNETVSTQESPLVLYVEDDEDDATKTKLKVVSRPADKIEFDKDAAKAKVIPAVSKNPATSDPELKSEYDYQDPDTIFDDLRTYTNMVINGTQPSMLITGTPGSGKTYNVTQELKKAGMKKDVDYYYAKGKSTAAGMYQVLWENNDKLIIFDDMDSIFKDDNAINILKGALDSGEEREISWLSARPLKTPEGKDIPQKFDFTGRVIFISNLAQKSIDPAIKSRSFVIEVALSPDDMVGYIEGMFDTIMPYERVSTKRYALDSIKDAAENNPKVQINMRTFIKAVKIVKNVKDPDVALRLIIQQTSYK